MRVILGFYWGFFMGIMEKEMETTIMGYIGVLRVWGLGLRV